MTKQIELTQGQVAIVDDEDFEFLNQWKWFAQKDKNTFYAVRGFGKRIRMHRVIMNTPNDMQVDHIDGNGLNNTRANLRNCTVAENTRNRKKPSTNTSGYMGVFPSAKKWRAEITHGKKIHLGYFDNPVDAAHAYDQAAKEYFGEFAKTNF